MLKVTLGWLLLLGVAGTEEEEEEKAAPQFVIVEGQVTDAYGVGQTGVTVTVRRKSTDGSKGDVIASATTDKMGDFAVRAAEQFRGEVVVTISKEHFADLVTEMTVGGEEVPFIGEALRGNLMLTGMVVDSLGQRPVAGAKIVLETGPDRLQATTDEQGRYSLSGVSPGDAELVVEAENYGREQVAVVGVEGQKTQNVSLKPERIVRIKVLDEGGKSIPGVVVECFDPEHTDMRNAVSDQGGMAVFSGLHFDAAVFMVRLKHKDFVSSPNFDRRITPPKDAKESSHEFTLGRAATVAGRITSAADGKPLQGARVIVGDEYSDSAPRDFTDPEGKYSVHGVRPGTAALTVHASGYAPELKTIETKAAEAVTLDLTLGPAQTIEGVVKSDQGKPIANVELVAVEWRGKATLGLRATTDKEGRFRMENAPADSFDVMIGGKGTRQSIKAGGVVEITLAGTSDSTKPKGLLQVGEPVPAITMRTLSGESISFAELKGKTVLVDFWATWCHPCVEELVHFERLHEKYGKRKDFLIIGISKDHEVDLVRDHLKGHPKATWPQVAGAPAGAKQAVDAFGVTALPQVFIIGPDGKVLANHLRTQRIEEAVDEAMTQKAGG